MSEFVKILLIILLSSVKFVAGPPFAYYDERYDFSFFETVIYCVLGGMLGVSVFTFFSIELQLIASWFKNKYKKVIAKSRASLQRGSKAEIVEFTDHGEHKKLFTPRNRKFVRIWRKYGLIGVAFLTPVFISIPIGTIIANAFEDNKKKIFLYMLISIVFWSVFFTSMFELYHVVDMNELKEKVVG
ncbi:MAG: hypothetical protein IPN54_04155 [Bacteroidetes bacterium]|nr:hypothetical protein [Bacteroidota bacterium]MBK9423321.1 hypothetical protein [Bacteroidota bacterium]